MSQEITLKNPFNENITSYDDLMDFMELKMVELCDMVSIDVRHRVSDGMYTREAHAPANTLITSKRHKTSHQFIISKGSAWVFTDGEGWKYMSAPFHGQTTVGVRRLIWIEEDIVWTSIHPTEKTKIQEIEDDLVEYENNLLKEKI